MPKTAIVLFNLGGPSDQAAVRPFLFNMFRDRAILRIPWLPRMALAWLISTRRAPVAREIYAQMGGGSPILPNTQAQAEALEAALGEGHKVFIAMRYWHPRALQTVREVKAYAPERIVLLPLYPQFSTTTTQSSFDEWECEARRQGLHAETRRIESYPVLPGFIDAMVELIRARLRPGTRILFSAHGLPEKIIQAGDPYQRQVEETVAATVAALGMENLDYVICYQSRVGPLKWIGPATDDEVRRAGAEGKAVLMAPVAFVSEHSETLVELDIEYAHLAKESGVPDYARVPTVGAHPRFIEGLAEMVRNV